MPLCASPLPYFCCYARLRDWRDLAPFERSRLIETERLSVCESMWKPMSSFSSNSRKILKRLSGLATRFYVPVPRFWLSELTAGMPSDFVRALFTIIWFLAASRYCWLRFLFLTAIGELRDLVAYCDLSN